MNGGHYLTKGHVILCLLYIKTSKDVKKYFGTLEKPFLSCKRPLAERSIRHFDAWRFGRIMKPPCNPSGFRKRAVPVQMCSF